MNLFSITFCLFAAFFVNTRSTDIMYLDEASKEILDRFDAFEKSFRQDLAGTWEEYYNENILARFNDPSSVFSH